MKYKQAVPFMKEQNSSRVGKPDDAGHDNDVMIGALEKDGENMMKMVENGGMAAILSGLEVMYVFVLRGKYQCVIHKFDAEDARQKAFDMNDRNRAMLKNLDSAADQLFEIKFKPGMDYVGVMMAAERGIINFMDYIGALPAEEQDFMGWQEKKGE